MSTRVLRARLVGGVLPSSPLLKEMVIWVPAAVQKANPFRGKADTKLFRPRGRKGEVGEAGRRCPLGAPARRQRRLQHAAGVALPPLGSSLPPCGGQSTAVLQRQAEGKLLLLWGAKGQEESLILSPASLCLPSLASSSCPDTHFITPAWCELNQISCVVLRQPFYKRLD